MDTVDTITEHFIHVHAMDIDFPGVDMALIPVTVNVILITKLDYKKNVSDTEGIEMFINFICLKTNKIYIGL